MPISVDWRRLRICKRASAPDGGRLVLARLRALPQRQTSRACLWFTSQENRLDQPRCGNQHLSTTPGPKHLIPPGTREGAPSEVERAPSDAAWTRPKAHQ